MIHLVWELFAQGVNHGLTCIDASKVIRPCHLTDNAPSLRWRTALDAPPHSQSFLNITVECSAMQHTQGIRTMPQTLNMCQCKEYIFHCAQVKQILGSSSCTEQRDTP